MAKCVYPHATHCLDTWILEPQIKIHIQRKYNKNNNSIKNENKIKFTKIIKPFFGKVFW